MQSEGASAVASTSEWINPWPNFDEIQFDRGSPKTPDPICSEGQDINAVGDFRRTNNAESSKKEGNGDGGPRMDYWI